MLARACSITSRTAGVSAPPRYASKSSAALRPSKKAYCTGENSQTLSEVFDKKAARIPFPSGMTVSDEPTEHVKQLTEQIMNSTFLEIAQLSRLIQKRLGTSGMMAAPMMMQGGAPPAAAPAAAAAPAPAAKPAEAAKPSRADVKIVSFPDAAKFKVLKEIRNLKPGMNLMESKALIEGLPKVVQEGLLYKEAEEWKKALTEAGAEIELV